MPITIQPTDAARLQLSGDAETVITISSRAIREGFAVAVSDGTLLRGTFDTKLRECSFVVSVDGSGSTSIVRGSHGDTVRLSAQIEWISVAAEAMHCARLRHQMRPAKRSWNWQSAGESPREEP